MYDIYYLIYMLDIIQFYIIKYYIIYYYVITYV